MPLDQTNWKPETETKPDLSKPSLEGLSWLLRRQMPPNHQWHFGCVLEPAGGGCGTIGCAIGLALLTWPDINLQIGGGYDAGMIATTFNMPASDAESIFHRSISYPASYDEITPQMVADRIDEFLRSRKIDAYLAETRK